MVECAHALLCMVSMAGQEITIIFLFLFFLQYWGLNLGPTP
jgi:hypothetical protein